MCPGASRQAAAAAATELLDILPAEAGAITESAAAALAAEGELEMATPPLAFCLGSKGVRHSPAGARPPAFLPLRCLAPYDPHVSSLALALREAILDEAPGAVESICRVSQPRESGIQSRRPASGPQRRAGRERQADPPYSDSQPGRPQSPLLAAVPAIGHRAGETATTATFSRPFRLTRGGTRTTLGGIP